MRKSSLGLAAIEAVAATGMQSAAPSWLEAAPAEESRPSRVSKAGRSYRGIGNGFRYPEQSTRQAMRGLRRAQGGPGIDLCPHLFEYVERPLEMPF
jgi:hypothetical protein